LMVADPCQKKVTTTADPRCGFRRSNPLANSNRGATARSFREPALVSNATAAGASLGVTGAMLNGALVPVRPGALAASVYWFPARSMLRPEKVATPFTAVTVLVPESVPPPGFAPNATVMSPLKVETRLPALSCAVTCTGGEIVLPALVLLG